MACSYKCIIRWKSDSDLSSHFQESRMVNDRQLAPQHADRETEDGFSGRPQHRTGSGRLSRGGQRGGGHRPERREPREGEGGGGESPSYIERSRGGRRGGRGGGGGAGGAGRGIMQQSGSGSDRKSKVNILLQTLLTASLDTIKLCSQGADWIVCT